ncbi:MAG TPA: CDP-glucose 4,6-dehydratase [Nitrospirota bacterium]|nr:CDP-glucose 4,6-dehydratase [Nitrospirota bacterium]
MIDKKFWSKKKVFITGHTGFKGSWLCLWLHSLGAEVHGYALKPPTEPSLFDLCKVGSLIQSSMVADVRDGESLASALGASKADIAIHMAAQPLVRDSYTIPVETYAINVMGTVNFFEAIRRCNTVRAVINVTTDKCYENKEWVWGYRECEPLGGYDPYSSSKACSELITSSYRSSFFNPREYDDHGVAIASARAGNVIGGGDWASDRLIPDCIRAILKNERVLIRNPHAIRPWQHVLEPLFGYLALSRKLYDHGPRFSGAWNFGPDEKDARSVEWVVKSLCEKWGNDASYEINKEKHPHEANYLKLDCSKAKTELAWRPRWDVRKAIESIVNWSRIYRQGGDVRQACVSQIEEYSGLFEG